MHSIRNSIEGTILRITSDKVMSEVILTTSSGPLVAVITTGSVKNLRLKKGDVVNAEIKATNISLAKCHCGKHGGPPGKGCSHE
jgi:molybdopterin-binding protein